MFNWKETTLGNEIQTLTDYTANGSFESLKINVVYYNETNYAALVRTTDLGKIIFKPERFTDEKGYKFLSKVQLFGGEIVVANVGSTGKTYRVPKCHFPMVLAPNMYLLKFKEGVDEDYIFQYFISSNFKDSLLKVIGSTTLQAVNKENLRSIKIKLPSKAEQTIIAKILRSADEVISNTEALVTKYQRIKTGLMQDLLTKGIDENGNIRNRATHRFVVKNGIEVPEEWEVEELSALGIVMTGSTPPVKDLDNYGEDFLFITPADVTRNQFIAVTERKLSQKGFSLCRKIPKNSICVVCIGSTIGKTGMTRELCTSNQQINSFSPFQSDLAEFYYYSFAIFLNEHLRKEAGLQAVPLVNKSSFTKMKIPFPKESGEAKKIIDYIRANQLVFEEYQNCLKKLQSLKTGLMQDLLSGNVRVKVNKNEKMHA